MHLISIIFIYCTLHLNNGFAKKSEEGFIIFAAKVFMNKHNRKSPWIFFTVLALLSLTGPVNFCFAAAPANNSSEVEQELKDFNNKAKKYWDISLDSSESFSRKAILLLNETGLENEEAAKTYLYLAVVLFYQSAYDSAIYYTQKGLRTAETVESAWAEGFANNLLCILYRKRADYDKAIQYGIRTVEIRKMLKDTFNLAGAYQNLANIYSQIGQPITAIDYLSKSLQLSLAINDTAGLMLAHGNIANLYLDMGDAEKGKRHLLKALQLKRKSLNYADDILGLGTIYHEFYQNYDSALLLFLEALSIYEDIGVEDGIATARENIGLVLLDKGDYRGSFKNIKTAEKLFNKMNDTTQIANVTLSLGKYYQRINHFDSANYLLNQALFLGEKMQHSMVVSESLQQLYLLHKKQDNYALALDFHEKYLAYSTGLEKALIDSKFTDMEAKYKAVENERRIEQLTHERERMKWRESQFYIIISFIVLMVITGAIMLYFKRKKELKIAHQQQQLLLQKKQLVEAELETKKAKQNEMEQDLEFKTKQLSTHALHMIQKNKMLQQVKQQLDELAVKVKAEFRPEFKKVNLLLARNMKTDKEWKLFSMYFEQVNTDFFKRLIHLYPSLNTNDLRHCALVKLNLNIKETASVLNLSPHTVKSARYRLKQKLNLKPENSLGDFIRNIC